MTTRWSEAAAFSWYAAKGPPLGCNFVPSTAVNALEMWQAESFDAATIDRELGLAAGLGMTAVRVFLHDLLAADPGFVGRLDVFLGLADRQGLATVPVLFESCWDGAPVAGPQPPPVPGVHNSRWVQSPGIAVLRDPAADRARLEAYVTSVVGACANDPRILMWDVWNEPDNGPEVDLRDTAQLRAKADLVAPLLDAAFTWVRAAGASQPLTSAVWSGDWSGRDRLTPIQRLQFDRSDVVTFHNYDGGDEFARRADWLAALGRPVICTEFMARPRGSTFAAIVPVARARGVGLFSWGLVRGRTQTHLPWDSWATPYLGAAPEPWFHDLLDPDGAPHDASEPAAVRRFHLETVA